MKLTLLFFISVFFLGACSPDAPTESSSTPSTEALNKQQEEKFKKTLKPTFVYFGEAEDKLPEFDFECTDCPLSFGQFLGTYVDGSKAKPANISSNCQGGLVADDLFMTNRHCIPKELQTKGADCSKQIKVLFPKVNNTEGEIVGCKEIIDLYEKPDGMDRADPQPDWAILKLEKSLPQRASEMAKVGIPDQTEVVAFVPLKGLDSNYIELKKVTCHSVQKSLRVPWYQSDISPIAYFKCDRDITRGFSGTLLYQSIDDELKPIATLSHIYDTQINNEKILVTNFILTSPFICIPGSEPLDEACEFEFQKERDLKNKLFQEALKPIKEKIIEEIASYKAEAHPIEWDEIDMDKVDSGQSTPQILKKWANIQGIENSFLNLQSKKLFFETMIQIQPRCLKKDHVPSPQDKKETMTKIPIISVHVLRTPMKRIEVEYQVHHIPVEVLPNRDNLKEYTYKAQVALPSHNRPESRVLARRFNHMAASVPVCP